MSQENVDVVRACLEGWNRGDFAAWERDAHPDIEFFSAMARLTEGRDVAWRGTEELRQFWDEWHSVWDLRVQLSEIRDFGETVVAFGTQTARGKASGAEVETSGLDLAQMRTVQASLFQIRASKVTRLILYFDSDRALADLGLEG
jgi:ketosteroid isomerase-like protein